MGSHMHIARHDHLPRLSACQTRYRNQHYHAILPFLHGMVWPVPRPHPEAVTVQFLRIKLLRSYKGPSSTSSWLSLGVSVVGTAGCSTSRFGQSSRMRGLMHPHPNLLLHRHAFHNHGWFAVVTPCNRSSASDRLRSRRLQHGVIHFLFGAFTSR